MTDLVQRPAAQPTAFGPAAGDRRSELTQHSAFSRVFQPGKLTFGLIAPLEAYPHSYKPALMQHAELVRQAEAQGFCAIWLRDVPFYDPGFGDVAQVYDPMVYAGWLAAHTRTIAIGTAGVILTLRDPVIVAKQAASIDQLLGGRFLLGLSTGDRPAEYPVFSADYEQRAERYRDGFELLQTVLKENFPVHKSRFHGRLDGSLDLIPKPVGPRMPLLAIGRCSQDISWLARNTDGWLWHQGDFRLIPKIIEHWRAEIGDAQVFKPYGYGAFFDLDKDPDAPLQHERGMRGGRHALLELWKQQESQGVSHVALNFRTLRRPAQEVMDELAEYILPHFPLN